jgi:hypothetical protein
MAIFRIRGGGAEAPLSHACAEEAARGACGTQQGQLAGDYESPAVMVVGSVRALTAGSAASGNKDANSQYYW